jgi:hypothetical protein
MRNSDSALAANYRFVARQLAADLAVFATVRKMPPL